MNIPNLLTIARLAALPVVLWLARAEHHVLAAALFVAAMLSDCVDGWLARRLDRESLLGLYLDPVVDKIVVLVMLYELAAWDRIPQVIPHLFLARELLQNAIRGVAATRGTVVGANWMGKTKATLQTVVITWGLLLPVVATPLPWSVAGLVIAAWTVLAVSWTFFGIFAWWNRVHLAGAA